jgi:hypothetical protein
MIYFPLRSETQRLFPSANLLRCVIGQYKDSLQMDTDYFVRNTRIFKIVALTIWLHKVSVLPHETLLSCPLTVVLYGTNKLRAEFR